MFGKFLNHKLHSFFLSFAVLVSVINLIFDIMFGGIEHCHIYEGNI